MPTLDAELCEQPLSAAAAATIRKSPSLPFAAPHSPHHHPFFGWRARMSAAGVRNEVLLARELFVGSLYMSTWPFVLGDVGFSSFSPHVTCYVVEPVLTLKTFLALRAMMTLLSYNCVCYALLFRPNTKPSKLLRAAGWSTLVWNTIGIVFYPRGCGDDMLGFYLPTSLVALMLLYAWCIQWKEHPF